MMVNNIKELGRPLATPATHRNEFPAKYSLAGWSPPAPASAFLASPILDRSMQGDQGNSVNGNCPNSRLSQKRAHSILDFMQASL